MTAIFFAGLDVCLPSNQPLLMKFAPFYICMLWFLPIVVLRADSTTITVMSYNIRMDTPADGPNAWPKRKSWVVQIIKDATADLVGLQEVTTPQMEFLVKQLPYGHYAVGRDNGANKGERCAIFYNSNRFELLDNGTFWLSKKPHEPGSKSWDAAITRIASWVKLRETGTGKELYFYNTHFDHKGEEARYYSMLLLKKQIRERADKIPVIVAGDFNFVPQSRPYNEINSTSSDYVLRDCFLEALEKDGELTCCGFDANNKNCSRIDYVLVSSAFEVQSYQVLAQSKKGSYASDHLPVICKVRF